MHKLSKFLSPPDRHIEIKELSQLDSHISNIDESMKTFKFQQFDPKMNDQIQVEN